MPTTVFTANFVLGVYTLEGVGCTLADLFVPAPYDGTTFNVNPPDFYTDINGAVLLNFTGMSPGVGSSAAATTALKDAVAAGFNDDYSFEVDLVYSTDSVDPGGGFVFGWGTPLGASLGVDDLGNVNSATVTLVSLNLSAATLFPDTNTMRIVYDRATRVLTVTTNGTPVSGDFLNSLGCPGTLLTFFLGWQTLGMHLRSLSMTKTLGEPPFACGTHPPTPPAPAPSTVNGGAYIIERMDDRIWDAAEDVWCVDCGLTTTLSTPDAILSAGSATGLGYPTGVTDLFGGQGYSAGTTADINDLTGGGAGVALTIASGIITAVTITGGLSYTNPQMVFTDPAGTGFGASCNVTLDNSAAFQASAAVFDVGMVGSVIRMGGGVATITAYNDTENVIANLTTPITAIIPNSAGIPLPQPSGEWSVAPQITTVGGLWHLIGFTVTGTADGAVIPPQTVADDGTITLDTPASLVTVGLAFTPQFQSLYLDGGQPTIQGQRKKIAAATIRLAASGVNGIIGGSNQPDGSAQSPPVIDMPWSNLVPFELRPDQGLPPYGSTIPPLWTGDVRQPIKGGFDKPGQVALEQTAPLPLNILAVIPEALEGDQPEQSYQQEPPRGGQRGPSRSGR